MSAASITMIGRKLILLHHLHIDLLHIDFLVEFQGKFGLPQQLRIFGGSHGDFSDRQPPDPSTKLCGSVAE